MVVARTAWPTSTHLIQFLAGANLIDASPSGDAAELDYTGAVASGLADWESRTGFSPFMSAAADSDRYFSPDGTRVLDLCGGLVAITSVYTGVSTTSTGSAQTVNDDYYPMPLNASALGVPYSWLKLACVWTGDPRSLKITGRWGYCANAAIPEMAWQAVLRLSALSLREQLEGLHQRGAGLVQLTEGDVTKRWEPGRTFEPWDREAKRYVVQYRRNRVV
jgi:hypothetical protein